MKTVEKKLPVGTRIIKGLQEFVAALETKKLIHKEFTCRVVELDLHPTVYDRKMVRDTRRMLRASQAVFALFLGVSTKTVRAWEQGLNVPSDIACRFMDEIRLNPDYWLKRLQELAVAKHDHERSA
jgi:putative transcriptional regulator